MHGEHDAWRSSQRERAELEKRRHTQQRESRDEQSSSALYTLYVYKNNNVYREYITVISANFYSFFWEKHIFFVSVE